MNKKGFTLTELVISIALLLLLAILVIPNLVNQDTKTKQKMYDERILLAKNAAYQYGLDNVDSLNSSTCTDVTIGTLINLKYLSATDDSGYIMENPLTGESMNNEIFCIKFIDNIVEVSKR